MSRVHLTVALVGVICFCILGISWAIQKYRWDVAGWLAVPVVLAVIGMDYLAGWAWLRAVWQLISYSPDWWPPTWYLMIVGLAVIYGIFYGIYQLTLFLVYAISRAWHQGAHDSKRAQDRADLH